MNAFKIFHSWMEARLEGKAFFLILISRKNVPETVCQWGRQPMPCPLPTSQSALPVKEVCDWTSTIQCPNHRESPPNRIGMVLAPGTHELTQEDPGERVCLLSGCGITDFRAEIQKTRVPVPALTWYGFETMDISQPLLVKRAKFSGCLTQSPSS